MGILLPPVPQANVTLTLHHRNRSLDSALQRIPEVDVTPSPECETSPTPATKASSSNKSRCREREDLASLGSDDSGILCGSDSGSSDTANATTRESSVDYLHSRESLDSSLSQGGDMDAIDVVDGDGIIMSVSPVETGLSDDLMMKGLQNGDCAPDEIASSDRVAKELSNGKCSPKELQTCEYFAKELRDSQAESKDFQIQPAVVVQNELAGAAMTLCCGTGQPEEESVQEQPKLQRQETAQPKPTEGCLLRLFESQVFDMSMAISYLFNSKEPGVQSYLGKITFLNYNKSKFHCYFDNI